MRLIKLPDCQVLVIISAIQTDRINLSPFTKDFRVWVAIYEISTIYPQAVPSGTATYNYQKKKFISITEQNLITLYSD